MMRLSMALGIAAAALTVAAYATPQTRVFISGGSEVNLDADGDGWVTRAEASAAFERLFDAMDGNDDGRLTREDHRGAHDIDLRVELGEHGEHGVHLEGADGDDCTESVEGDGAQRRVTVICLGGGERGAHRQGDDDGCTESVETEGNQRRVTVTCNNERRVIISRGGGDEVREIERQAHEAERQAERAERDAERLLREAERQAEHAGRDAERHIERQVTVIQGGEGGSWAMAPMAPMPMMLMLHSGEADTNGDGGLSREEFRNQHLRFFDASDVNGDGRIELRHPEPPAPPSPPEPPEPPARR